MKAIIRNRRVLALALAAAGALSAQTAMAETKKVPAAQPKPAIHAAKRPAVQVVRNVPLPRKRPLPAAAAPAPAPSKVALRGPGGPPPGHVQPGAAATVRPF